MDDQIVTITLGSGAQHRAEGSPELIWQRLMSGQEVICSGVKRTAGGTEATWFEYVLRVPTWQAIESLAYAEAVEQ